MSEEVSMTVDFNSGGNFLSTLDTVYKQMKLLNTLVSNSASVFTDLSSSITSSFTGVNETISSVNIVVNEVVEGVTGSVKSVTQEVKGVVKEVQGTVKSMTTVVEGVTSTIINVKDGVKGVINEVQGTVKSMTDIAKDVRGTFRSLKKESVGLFNLLKGAVNDTKSAFGKLSGSIKGIGGTVGNLKNKFINLNKAMSSKTAWNGVTRSLKLSGSAVSNFASKISSLTGSFVRAIPSILAFSAALLTNPITWIVLGVVALGTAIYLVIKHWDKIVPYLRNLWKKITAIWNSIKTYFSELWDSIKNLFKKAWDSGILPILLGPVGIIIKHWSKIKSFFAGIWSTVKKNAISMWDSIIVFIKDIPTRILGFFGDVGTGIIDTIVGGVTSAGKKIYNSVKDVLGPVGRLFNNSDAKEGPLSRVTASGQSLITTLASGVKSKGNLVKDAVSSSLEGTLPKSLVPSQRRDYAGGSVDSGFSNVSKGINIDFSSSKFYLGSGEELTEGSPERLRFEDELRGVFSGALADFA